MTPDEIATLKALPYTRGPWQVDACRFKWRYSNTDQVLDSHTVGPDGDAVCLVFYTDKYHAEQWANAHLIAAAPSLLVHIEQLERERDELRQRLAEDHLILAYMLKAIRESRRNLIWTLKMEKRAQEILNEQDDLYEARHAGEVIPTQIDDKFTQS